MGSDSASIVTRMLLVSSVSAPVAISAELLPLPQAVNVSEVAIDKARIFLFIFIMLISFTHGNSMQPGNTLIATKAHYPLNY